MPKLNTSAPTQPNKNYQPVAGGQDNKAGNCKKVAGKAVPQRSFLATLASRIRDTMICNRSISVVDSITPKIILPTQGLENAPEKDASANRPPVPATSQDHEEETELRPRSDEAGMDTDSELFSDEDTDELTQELTGDLTEWNEANDSGYFSEPTKKDTVNRQVADETAQNSRSYDANFLKTANDIENPAREAVELLEELEDSIMVNYHVTDFLNNCRTNQQWLDNPHDLTMVVLKKLQTIINDSSVSMHEKAGLDKNLATTAQQVLQYQLPQLDKGQAWERLDIYERLLSGNTYSRKMQLYEKAFDHLSSHFGLEDPWHFQMRRLDRGLAGPIAFAHLVETQDDRQKVLMLSTLLKQKTRLLNELNEVIQRYKTLDGNGFDDLPFAGNEQMAEMIDLAKTENSIRRRLGTWDEEALNRAGQMLKNLKLPVARATLSKNSVRPPKDARGE